MKIYHRVMSNCKQNYSSLTSLLYVNCVAKYFEGDSLQKESNTILA